MSFINYSSREINCKIVYYGPGLAELALNSMLITGGIYLSSRLGREVSAEEIRTSSNSKAFKNL